MVAIFPLQGGSKASGVEMFYCWYFQEEQFKIRKINSDPYACDNLNQIYQFFSFLKQSFEKSNFKSLENYLERNRLNTGIFWLFSLI